MSVHRYNSSVMFDRIRSIQNSELLKHADLYDSVLANSVPKTSHYVL